MTASTTGSHNSEEYKRFAELLGAPKENSSEKDRIEDIAKPVEEDQAAQTAKMAADYEKMAQVLGPPAGRFRKRVETIRASKRSAKVEVSEKTTKSSSGTSSSGPQAQIPSGLKREAKTREEEYALLEGVLRKSSGKGNRPRKGGRRYATWETNVEGLVVDPWNTDFSLMPVKNPMEPKTSQAEEAQASYGLPETPYLDEAGIEQSYWALEQLLDDEEDDWQDAQEEKKRAEEEKRKAKLLRKPVHPNDAKRKAVQDIQATAPETAVPKVREQEPSSVLQPPPKRVLESDVSGSSPIPRKEQQRKAAAPSKGKEQKSKLLLQKPVMQSLGENTKEISGKVSLVTDSRLTQSVPHTDTPSKKLMKKRTARGVDNSALLLQNPKLLRSLGKGHFEQ